jgi:nucleoside-diphosphate-sugar epimerase
MESIFITGVSGFVGRHLVEHFRDDGGIKLFGNSRKKERINGVTLLDGCDAGLLKSHNITTFIHLAGIAHDLSNQYKPEDYYRVNFEGTKRAVDEFLKSDATHFIFVSSIKAACDISSVAVDESMLCTPKTDYGKSKRQAEEYIMSLNWPKDKSYYILRPVMMHGAGNKGNLNLLYRYAKWALPFPFGAFQNQRSFHSIDNFTFVIHQLLTKEIPSGIYHLADEGYLSTVELYALICKTLNKKPLVWTIPEGWVRGLASMAGKSHLINKLTEDMMVPNQKITAAIGRPMPVSLVDGLVKTIHSFS